MLRLVLTKAGQTTRTYDISSSTNRILRSVHIEQEWSQTARFNVEGDSTLAALSLEGYTATISYGYNTSAGDEYSACAPLEVVAMASDTVLDRPQSVLSVGFSAAGVFDLMEADKASVAYTQLSSDTNTVKTLLSAIAAATLVPFTHCKAYTITYDSEDSLINTYIPADDFQVSFNESRLSAFKKLIEKTNCKAIIKADGAIHVLNPTVSGTTYAYQYNDAATNHNFFEKGTRKRLVIPTKRIVSSHPGASPSYTGNATDSASETALGRSLPEPIYIRAISNAQCTAIAGALLQNDQVAAEVGHGIVPMNCGQELMDYVKITDSIAGDTRTGNVSYIRREYVPGKKFKCEIRFGKVSIGLPFLSSIGEDADPGWQAFYDLVNYIDKKDNMILQWFLDGNWGTLTLDEIINGETYSKLLTTQISAGKIYLSSANVFDTEYNPSSKRRVFNTTPTTPYAVGDLWFDASVIKRCTTARASGDYVTGDWTAVTLDELTNGSTYVKVLATDISAGHIKLTSSTVSAGKWYDNAGVSIDADNGIIIYGSATAFRTRATINGADQCYMGSDGAIMAGAGRVSLGAGGLIINRPDATLTEDLIFKYAGVAVGYIYPFSPGVAILGNIDLALGNASGGGIEIFAGSLAAPEANTLKLRAVASASLASGSKDPTPAGNDIWIDSDDDVWIYADADIFLAPGASGSIVAQSKKITSLANPTLDQDAVTRYFLEYFLGASPLTVALLHSYTPTGDATNPEYINDYDLTNTHYCAFAVPNKYVEIDFGGALHSINTFRHYGQTDMTGDGRWKIQYKNLAGAWIDWAAGIPINKYAAWSDWETGTLRKVCTGIRWVCEGLDTAGVNRLVEIEVTG